MSEQDVYKKFVEYMRTSFLGMCESEEVLPMVKARYTPEEAELLTGISFANPFANPTLEELAEQKKMNPAVLRSKLDDAAKKGVVFRTVDGNTIHYALNDAFFVFMRSSFWPGLDNEASRTIAPFMNRYFHNGFFDEAFGATHIRGLRTIPIEETIDDTRTILPYEDVVKALDSLDYFCVATCPCRHRRNLDPDTQNCKHPVKNCLHFGELARYMVEQGLGDEITKEEVREILKKAADSGLVHGISNWQEGVDTICNCCKRCCMWFESYHVLKHSDSLDPSNYRVAVTQETCKGCGLCVKRCPMESLRLEESPLADKEGIIRTYKTGKCQVVAPGMGDRVMAGVQDHEMIFLIPEAQFESVLNNLFLAGNKISDPSPFGIPHVAPTLGPNEIFGNPVEPQVWPMLREKLGQKGK